VRRLSHELRPTLLDDMGLVPALEYLAQGISERTGMPITIEGFRDSRLPPGVETALYRVVREALNNVVKHAKATRVRVSVQKEGAAARCSVRDDGVGFDVSSVAKRKGERGFGLAGIRERLGALSGTVQINSAPGWGTELLVTIPLET
jgi:signal transduction histidine kinase